MSFRALHPPAILPPIALMKEGRVYVAYSPALDLSASGNTLAGAKKNFETTLRLFLKGRLAGGGPRVEVAPI
jgi:hypothetical protein